MQWDKVSNTEKCHHEQKTTPTIVLFPSCCFDITNAIPVANINQIFIILFIVIPYPETQKLKDYFKNDIPHKNSMNVKKEKKLEVKALTS